MFVARGMDDATIMPQLDPVFVHFFIFWAPRFRIDDYSNQYYSRQQAQRQAARTLRIRTGLFPFQALFYTGDHVAR